MIISAVKNYRLDTRYSYGLVSVSTALAVGFCIAWLGLAGVAISIMAPLLVATVIGILLNPKIGLFLYLQLGFLVPCIGHFIAPNAPIGLAVETMLVITLVSVILHRDQMQWQRLRNPAFYLLLIWVAFTCLEFFNPETPNRVPTWLYRFRSISFQPLCVAIIVSVTAISRRDVKIFLGTWLLWSFGAALWAFKQQYLGLTASETAWLHSFGGKTHLLFGQLRSYSFYSDAAQLGAEMAGVTLFCLVMAIEVKQWLYRLLFMVLTCFFFWGYAVTATRSALFVIIVGFVFFLFLKRDVIKIAVGGSLLTGLMAILMFTDVGNANYQIYRIRTALHPSQDASFTLRLENQEKLVSLLKPLPFGVGLGTSATPGDIYNPDHWASQIPPDTWYVILWIELGSIGLAVYLGLLLSYVLIGTYKLWQMEESRLRLVLMIMLSVFTGLMAMAYSNTILGQFPTTTIMFISIFLITTCERWSVKSVQGSV